MSLRQWGEFDFLKLKNGIVVLALLSIPFLASGQYGLLNYGGIRGFTMGNIGVTLKSSEGLFINPATITDISNFGAALSSERRFEDSGINQFGLSLAKNLNSFGSAGLIIQQVGVESFNQTKIGLVYARKLSDNFSIGAQFNAQQIRIDQYGSKTVFNASVGLLSQITQDIAVGLALHNPIPMEILDGEDLPLTLVLGFDFKPTEKVAVFAEIEKDVDFPVNIKTGIEYLPINRLAVRLGVNSEPTSIHFGIGTQVTSNIWIDAGVGYSQELGLSPGLGIALR